MNHTKRLTLWSCGSLMSALALFLLVGCQSSKEQSEPSGGKMTTATAPAPAPAVTAESSSTPKAIRIDAGAANPYTDSEGNVWLPDQGFADGDTVDRGDDVKIANTKDPAIYRTEHYGMTSFSQKVPNAKYIVKLHFAETYEDITGAGQCVFSFNVGGHEIKDFDVYAKAGGALRAYVETVNANVTDGKLDITFTPDVQSPEINGIEIIPAP
ncbi:MAG: malectin [Verrucomicrobiia bacterium]